MTLRYFFFGTSILINRITEEIKKTDEYTITIIHHYTFYANIDKVNTQMDLQQ